jgi:hypothetical protein
MPNVTSAAAQLADIKLDGHLVEFVESRRAAGQSWRMIRDAIRDATGLDITHETIRNWFDATPIARAAS